MTTIVMSPDQLREEFFKQHIPPGAAELIQPCSVIWQWDTAELSGIIRNQFIVFTIDQGFHTLRTVRIRLLGCELPDSTRFLSTSPSGMAEAHRSNRVGRFIESQLKYPAPSNAHPSWRRRFVVQTFQPVADVSWYYGVVFLRQGEVETNLNFLVNQFMQDEDCTPVCCGPAPDGTQIEGTPNVDTI